MSQTHDTLKIQIIPVTPFQQNCSMIWDSETLKGVFVDPGGEPEKLIAAAKDKNIQIEACWLTHGHLDHAGAADELRETLGSQVIGPHADDQFWMDTIAATWAQYGHPGMGKDVVPDIYLKDGDELTLGEHVFHVLHTPGHTPGHVIIYHEGLKIAFVGDVLFRGSIGRTDFPKGNHAQLLESIKTKLWPLGGDMRFIPGHGPMGTFAMERKDNPYVADHILGQAPENRDGVM